MTLEAPMPWAKDCDDELPRGYHREWLATNGLGGYAAGTIAGGHTRRFHGLLVAALPPHLGRMMMLNQVEEALHFPGGRAARRKFRLEAGLPVWRIEAGGIVVEKSIFMPHLRNTVCLRYRMLSGEGAVGLRLRPSLHFRHHQGRVDEPMTRPYETVCSGARCEARGEEGAPPLRLRACGASAAFSFDGGSFREVDYPVERRRGYDSRGTLWSPGILSAELTKGSEAALAASTEPWEDFAPMEPGAVWSACRERRERLLSSAAEELRTGEDASWVLAADQFIVAPPARKGGGRSIVAGYHWFTDWGRDTMIGLEGLTLLTGRHEEAGAILRMFSSHIRRGLIPNLFPEGEEEGRYHTADATLWFFHALDRYLAYTSDRALLSELWPKLAGIVERHAEGTDFGIGVDPADGLLRQGEEGLQLTWMDAKVGEWVVTPRRGKAVEINALWYNALRLMERWAADAGEEASAGRYRDLAGRARESFNRRFWNARAGCLHDVVDGEERDLERLRPNQIFAVSLPHAVLEPSRRESVVEAVRRELLTPVGLRTLARGDADYKPYYFGDTKSRDAAYHQGTVWPWLIGPFIDAWLKVHPGDKAGARRFLSGLDPALEEPCAGTIGEIFDAEPPFAPRGCVAQAWSVAEVMRAWVKTSELSAELRKDTRQRP